ncbi:MAG: DMT family transporter [Xanthobacteraceae bacterium]
MRKLIGNFQERRFFFAVNSCGTRICLPASLRGKMMSTSSAVTATGRKHELSRFNSNLLKTSVVFGVACFAIALFALVPATSRIAGAQLSGISVGLIRTVGAGFFSLPLLFILRPAAPGKRDWGLLLLYAFGNFAGFPILFTVGVQHTSGSHAALIMATMPLSIALIGMMLERRLPRGIWFVGAAIALTGEAVLVTAGNMSRSGGASTVGDTVVFIACALSAIGIVAGARLGSRTTPLGAALWAITIASATLAPWAVMRLLAAPHVYQNLTGTTWCALLQITFGAAVVANISLLWAVARGGLVRVAPVQFAQPVCALFLASALLNEHLSASILLMTVSIVFGTVTACLGARPHTSKIKNELATLQTWLKNSPKLTGPEPDHIGCLVEPVPEPVDVTRAMAPRLRNELALG